MWRIFKRILIGSGVVIAALVVLLAGSIAVDGALGGGRVDAVANVRIPNADGPEVRAYVAKPATPGPHPAVIMIHEVLGLTPNIAGRADLLAEAGYVVIAPDVFRGSSTEWIPRAIYQAVSTPPEQINGDLEAVFTWLASQPDVQADRIAMMGFCFGGGTSLRYSLTNNQLAATVLFYGPPINDVERLKSLPGPVLGIFGGTDPSIPAADVQAFESALTEAGVQNQISIYDGQPHAFITGAEGIRTSEVQGRAWNELLTFLNENLQGDATSRRDVAPTRGDNAPAWGYLLRLALAHVGHTH